MKIIDKRPIPEPLILGDLAVGDAFEYDGGFFCKQERLPLPPPLSSAGFDRAIELCSFKATEIASHEPVKRVNIEIYVTN